MDKTKDYITKYLTQVKEICESIDEKEIGFLIEGIRSLKERKGRLFILGVGGSAANASHCVNDFRKIVGIECYAPTDNVAELTARINDEGWDSCFAEWLKNSNLNEQDAVLVLSVGGGSSTTSQNIVRAVQYSVERNASVYSIVSRGGGYARQYSDVCVLVPVVEESMITPHAEEWQGIIWHLLANYNYEN